MSKTNLNIDVLGSSLLISAEEDPDYLYRLLELYRQKLEQLLTELTDEAERWAASGQRIVGESILIPGPKHSMAYYGVNHNYNFENE